MGTLKKVKKLEKCSNKIDGKCLRHALTRVDLLAKSQKASNRSEKQADSKSRYNARENTEIKQGLKNVSMKFRKADRFTRVIQSGQKKP